VNGIYVIAEIGGPLGDRIRALQQRFDPKMAAELPPHVTLVGSSGAGPISPDTPTERLREAIEPVTAGTPPLSLRFGRPMRFLQREIVVLPLDPHGPLRTLHEKLKQAGLPFASARWPYTPHCTLNFYQTLTESSLRQMLAVRVEEPWQLDSLRVYHSRELHAPKLLFEVSLTG
jgi:2'-5' RNA ligase